MAETTSDPISVEARLNAEYDVWFERLQSLTDLALAKQDWVSRWYDGFTPIQAFEAGPEGDEAA
jgi:hypothetical protein